MIKIINTGNGVPPQAGGQILHTIKVILVASIIDDNKIGIDDELLIHDKNDMIHFRETTMSRFCVMGRKTFETIPGGEGLSYRTNYVLTRETGMALAYLNRKYKDFKNKIKFGSFDNLIQECIKNNIPEIYVIGGSEIYQLFIDYADVCILSQFSSSANKELQDIQANKFFPDLNKNWKISKVTEYYLDSDDLYFKIRYYYNSDNILNKYISRNMIK